jgi:uncharacterized repeat protein (TIGR01451 family)
VKPGGRKKRGETLKQTTLPLCPSSPIVQISRYRLRNERIQMKRFAILVTGALLLLLTSLFPMTNALADSKSITFEPPTYSTTTPGPPPGSIDGQDGWAGSGGTPINPLIDQAVVATSAFGSPTGFDAQSFRMSNAYTDGSFADWPFSPSLTNEAGETNAVSDGFSGGIRQPHFEASFDVASAVPTAEQPGLQISISPDRGDGARMSFLRVRDTPTGLAVDFIDYESGLHETGCATGSNFVLTTVATGLSRSAVHTIGLTMDFLDGPANDVVKVYVDGHLVHTGTSWEDYFRECELNPTRTVDSLIFQARTSGGTAVGTLGNGFLFDNLSYSSGPRPSYADLSVSKTASPDPVHVGQKLTYTVDVTNNGPDSATGTTVVDTLPKTAGFGSVSTTKGSCSRVKKVVTCSLGTLHSGDLETVTILVKPTKKGTITNTATVSANQADQNTANNTATVSTTVLP